MILETERLVLRPLAACDAGDVCAYLRAPTVNCFASLKVDSVGAARDSILRRMAEEAHLLAVVLRASGRVIGELSARAESSAPDADGAFVVCDTYSPAWMLNPDYRGRGYAYEAVRAFFDALFRRCGARRIYAYAEEDNLPSRRLCEKLGMRPEGRFVDFVTFVRNPDGSPRYETTLQYAILRREWEGRYGGPVP